jgi:hypothetical protein
MGKNEKGEKGTQKSLLGLTISISTKKNAVFINDLTTIDKLNTSDMGKNEKGGVCV